MDVNVDESQITTLSQGNWNLEQIQRNHLNNHIRNNTNIAFFSRFICKDDDFDIICFFFYKIVMENELSIENLMIFLVMCNNYNICVTGKNLWNHLRRSPLGLLMLPDLLFNK